MSAAAGDPHRRPRLPLQGERLPSSFGLALLMHVLLFGGMTLAVQWRTQPSAPVVAEIWSSLPPAAPVEVAPPPPPPPPAPKVERAPEPEAEIALKVEPRQPVKIEPPKVEKKPEPKKEEKKPEPKKEEKKPEPKPEPRKEPPKEAKKAPPKEEPPRPRTDMERLMAQAGVAPAPGGATTASTTTSGVRGSDSGYSALVIGCIRPHIAYAVPDGTSPNVFAEFLVELLPDGAVAAVRLVRPSGLASYDAAAERAIRRCDPFPRKRDGSLDRQLTVVMRPVETR